MANRFLKPHPQGTRRMGKVEPISHLDLKEEIEKYEADGGLITMLPSQIARHNPMIHKREIWRKR